MTDHYSVLSLSADASGEEVKAAFEDVLAARKAKRARTADVHAAYAVLGDKMLRRAYDATRMGRAASDKAVHAREQAAALAKEVIPDLDWTEVRQNVWLTTLKATVLISGASARAADVAGVACRSIQVMAARRLAREVVLPHLSVCADDEVTD